MRATANIRLSYFLGFSVLILGICGICYEYTISKLATDMLGNSSRQWGLIIGLMMFFMGVGADVQKYLPDKLCIEFFLGIQLFLGLLGGLSPTLIFYAFSFAGSHFVLVHYGIIISIGLLVGLEIPLMIRIYSQQQPELKENLSLILKLDYLGGFAGALLWIFLLPKFFDILQMGLFIGLCNILIGLLGVWWFFKQLHQVWVFLASGLLCLGVLFIGLLQGNDLRLYAEQRLYKDPIIFSTTTPYQHILITERQDGSIYMYLNGNLQFASTDEYIYHEMLVHPIFALPGRKQKVLILGGGDGLAAREVLKYPEVESVLLVDLDEQMVELAKTYPKLTALNQNSLNQKRLITKPPQGLSGLEKQDFYSESPGFFTNQQFVKSAELKVMTIDAFKFVQQFSQKFDKIILDFPDPNSLELSKLYTVEFYSQLKKLLAFDGLLIQQSSSPSLAKEAFLVIGRSIDAAGFSALPMHTYVPSFGDWGFWVAGHKERFTTHKLKQYFQGPYSIPADVQYITPEVLKASFLFGKQALNSPRVDTNHLLRDRVFEYYREASRQFFSF